MEWWQRRLSERRYRERWWNIVAENTNPASDAATFKCLLSSRPCVPQLYKPGFAKKNVSLSFAAHTLKECHMNLCGTPYWATGRWGLALHNHKGTICPRPQRSQWGHRPPERVEKKKKTSCFLTYHVCNSTLYFPLWRDLKLLCGNERLLLTTMSFFDLQLKSEYAV